MNSFEQKKSQLGLSRWLAVSPLAASVTFGLIILMYQLVFVEEPMFDSAPPYSIPDMSWKPPAPIENRIKKPTPPERVEPAPRIPQPVVDRVIAPNTSVPGVIIKVPGVEGGILDPSSPLAQFLVSPRYPGRALARGLEGYVDVHFDVSATGATENIQVMNAQPKGIFENAAVAAVKRWKFRPKSIKGRAVAFRGMSRRVVFEIKE